MAFVLLGAGLLVGTFVWATSGMRLPATLLMSSALGFQVLTVSVSLIASREITLSASDFRWLLGVYHFSNNLFSLSLLALLWRYPNRQDAWWAYGLLAAWVILAWLLELCLAQRGARLFNVRDTEAGKGHARSP